MKQVRFFSEVDFFDLEREVNAFIEEQQGPCMNEIADIQYHTYVDGKGKDRWTAMVVYGK